MKNAIVLCSGGLDSVVTAHYVKEKLHYDKIIVLFFNYGQRNLKQEKNAVKYCARSLNAELKEIKLRELKELSNSLLTKKDSHNKIKISDLKDSSNESIKWYVPLRNSIFLNYASALSEAMYVKDKLKFDIFVGFKNEGKESYPDTTKAFVSKINELNEIASISKTKVIAPLINKDKEEIVKLGNSLNVDFSKTYSCYSGKYKLHCGTCLSCRLRQEGFYWANILDPTKYMEKMNDFRLSK